MGKIITLNEKLIRLEMAKSRIESLRNDFVMETRKRAFYSFYEWYKNCLIKEKDKSN